MEKGIMQRYKKREDKALAYGELDISIHRKIQRKRAISLVFAVFLICVFALFCVGQIGHIYADTTLHFWQPDYEKADISALLEKTQLSEVEYDFLYRQTGLTKLGIDDMRSDEAGRTKIKEVQNVFFTKYDITTRRFGTFTYTEELGLKGKKQYSVLAELQDGDILVSSSMYVSWWRWGHAALVVDGTNNRILEAIKPGHKSEVGNANVFSYRANFILLRPKVDEDIKQQVVQYAKDSLVGINYSLYTGYTSPKYTAKQTTSNCGHIVWRAYKEYGIDVDSNGGGMVLPKDIYASEYMQVVQVFGLDLDKLWE